MRNDMFKRLKSLKWEVDHLITNNNPEYRGPSTYEIAAKLGELIDLLVDDHERVQHGLEDIDPE